MKRLNLLLTFCAAFLFSFTTACSDDDDIKEWPGGTSAKLLPVKISGKDNGGQQVFEYDNNNRLTALTYYSMFEGKLSKTSELKIEYDAEGRIKQAVEDAGDNGSNTYAFTYDGSKITILDKYFTKHIEIDNQGRMLKRKEYTNASEEVALTYSCTYDPKGNVLTEEYENSRRLTYAYDNQNGIFCQINTLQWFLVNMLRDVNGFINNYTEIETSLFGTEEYATPIPSKRSYIYNKNGYPVKYTVPNHSIDCSIRPESNFEVEYKEAK